MLVTGDHAGPAASGYALHGVDLERDVDKRPFGWEDELQFGRGLRGPGIRSPVTMWYIEGANARIVVDTGYETGDEGPRGARAILAKHGFSLWTDHRAEWSIDEQLAKVGIRPEDVDVVVNTHFHFDHIGNNTRFPNATFIAQRQELSYAVCPPAWAQFYYADYAHNVLDIADRLILIDGEMKVADGVSVVCLGGHTPGSQVVLVETEAGRVCLAGDLLYFYRNLELSWPVGSFFDVDELMRGYAWMRRNADIVVPQHDWKFYELYPEGFVG
jgi:glyoxylase-like metal-dependent hydrolase (beta-lactamase superfamily II)